MNNTVFLEQLPKPGNLDSNLILGQNKLDLMARFMEIKPENPNLKQN